ncbi:hypothetical protein ACFFLM_11225 [Deinococcus oregonensis]|uniref:Guanylate kinase n=1 Tax=Deinococcus oregonensis TaxID=1805970 RepID=A0ABV6AYG1_9DEIO
MLIVVTGVRGAGKTTLINRLSEVRAFDVLQPSTTRKPRGYNDHEYDFVEEWNDSDYAWTIKVGSDKYGFRNSEVEKAKSSNCIIVFDPLQLEVLQEFLSHNFYDIVTVGVDTLNTIEDQADRINNDAKRIMSKEDFTIAREVVKQCDLVLKGNEEDVFTTMVNHFKSNNRE